MKTSNTQTLRNKEINAKKMASMLFLAAFKERAEKDESVHERERERNRKRNKERWWNDESYRQKKISYAKERRKKLKEDDPEKFKERKRIYVKRNYEKIRKCPEKLNKFREYQKVKAREYRKRNKERCKQLRKIRYKKQMSCPFALEIKRKKQREQYRKRQLKKGKIVKSKKDDSKLKEKLATMALKEIKQIAYYSNCPSGLKDDLISFLQMEFSLALNKNVVLSKTILKKRCVDFFRSVLEGRAKTQSG